MTKVITTIGNGKFSMLFRSAAKASAYIMEVNSGYFAKLNASAAHLGTYEPGDSKRFPIIR